MDVLELVKSGRLLGFEGQLHPKMMEAVEDFAQALRLSTAPEWVNLRARLAPGKPDMRVQEPLYRHCLAYLPVKFHPAMNEIVGDLAMVGGKGPFQELLRAAYLAGGWPCGWKGAFPRGQLQVFWDPQGKTPDPPGSERLGKLLEEQLKLRTGL